MNLICKIGVLLCCLISSVAAAPKFLTISDIHYGSKNMSVDGQDTGADFLKITLNEFQKLSQHADFIINLGDLPTHLLFVTPKRGEYERAVFRGLYMADKDKKPMFYVVGNNDSLLGNYQLFEYKDQSPLNFASDWKGACAYCDGLIINDQHMKHDGYYSAYVMPDNKDIMLIALNTVEWAKIPALAFAVYDQDKDAQEQLNWLETQLKTHHAKQLLIAMHIPPGFMFDGKPMWRPQYQKRFIDLLQKYQPSYGQITLLTGHTHMDELRKIKLNNGAAVYAYSTPAISRIHHNNPGMKLFDFNNNMQIANFTTYYTSNLNDWGSESYSAMGTTDSIFPECHNESLADCLNHYNIAQVCERLESGLFYSAKSPRTKHKGCQLYYPVN